MDNPLDFGRTDAGQAPRDAHDREAVVLPWRPIRDRAAQAALVDREVEFFLAGPDWSTRPH